MSLLNFDLIVVVFSYTRNKLKMSWNQTKLAQNVLDSPGACVFYNTLRKTRLNTIRMSG